MSCQIAPRHQLPFYVKAKFPSNTTYGYDFRETSAASHAVVVEKVKKADFGDDHDYTGQD